MESPGNAGRKNGPVLQTECRHPPAALILVIAACLVIVPSVALTNTSCCCSLYNVSCCPVKIPDAGNTTANGSNATPFTYEPYHIITGTGYEYVEDSVSGFGVHWKFIADAEALERLNQSASYRLYGPGTYKGLFSESAAKGEPVTGGEKTKAGLGTTGGGRIFLNDSSVAIARHRIATDNLSGAQQLVTPTVLSTAIAPQDPAIARFAYCSPVNCQRI